MKTMQPIEKHFAQMHEVFGMPGVVGASFALLTAVSDIVHEKSPGIPLLWVTGPRASGKTTLAGCIQRCFSNMSATMFPSWMKHSTQLFDKLERPNHPLELEDMPLEPSAELVECLKGVHDRIGARVVMNDLTIRRYKISSTLVMTGVDLPVVDEALMSRCVLLELPEHTGGNEEPFRRLWDGTALDELALCPVTDQRGGLRKCWDEDYAIVESYFRRERTDLARVPDRLVRNIAKLSAVYSFYADYGYLQLPVTVQVLNEYLVKLALRQLVIMDEVRQRAFSAGKL